MNTLRRQPHDQCGAAMLWALAVMTLVLALVLTGAPFVIKWYLQRWLEDQGVVNVSIADVDLNPFMGRFAIEAIAYEEDGEQRRADHLGLDLQWADLRQRRIRLADARVQGARLAIRRSETEGLFLGSIALGAAEAAQSAERTQAESGWGFGIDRLELENVLVDYEDPLVTQRVLFEELVVEDFATWAPERITRLRATLSAEEQRLDVSGEIAPLATPWTVDLAAQSQGLRIDNLGPFLIPGDDVTSTGVLETDLRVRIEATDDLARLQALVEGSLGLGDLQLAVTDSRAGVGLVAWDGTVDYDQTGGAESTLVLDGGLRLERVAATRTGPLAETAAADLSWQGRIEYGTASGSSRISAAGKLLARELGAVTAPTDDDTQSGGDAVSLRLNEVELQADDLRAIRAGQGDDIAWEGSIGLRGLEAASGPQSLGLGDLSWSGRSTFVDNADVPQLSIDGNMQLDEVVTTDTTASLRASLRRLAWSGRAEVDAVADGRIHLTGEIGADAMSARRATDAPALLQIGRIRGVFEPAAAPGVARLGSLDLEDLGLLERPVDDRLDPFVALIARVAVDGATVGQDGADIGLVTLSDARFSLERQGDGSLDLGAAIPAGDDRAAPSQGESEDGAGRPSASYPVRLAGILTSGNTRLSFADRSVKPAVSLLLDPLQLSIGSIDTARPGNATDVSLETQIGQFTSVTFDGSMQPLAPDFGLLGQGTVRSLDLVELDGYARRNTSHRVDSGTLRADIEVDLADGRLDSLARMKIFNLELRPLDDDEKDEYSQELGVPLTTALDLLRDKEDNITLDVPLEGELSDLSAGIGGALRIVLNKGIQAGIRTAATTYFAPLWPALAAGKLLGAATALRFRPVEFAPGEDALTAEAVAYLSQMGEILVDRPKLSITVCGRFVGADLTLLHPDADAANISEEQSASLVDLARRRHQTVKQRLVETGVEPSRVATCAVRPTVADAGPPRADFGV